MKPLKAFILIPALVACGMTATANGDDTVKVRASILFDVNGFFFGYQEPPCERVVVVERPVVVERHVVVERPVVHVHRVERQPVCIVERPRPVVVYHDTHRGAHGPGRGLKLGHYKQETRRIVVEKKGFNQGRDYHKGRQMNEVIHIEKGKQTRRR
jgi:hypothetical protein